MSVVRTNVITRIRTWLLIAGLTGLMVAIGGVIGGGALPVFIAIAVVMNVAMYWFSDKLALKMSRAQPVEAGALPAVRAMVEELAGRAEVPVPRLYLIASQQPNAFATGRNPKHSAVAVTQGLLDHLSPEQVRGVLAHEFAHIKNRDILVSSIAGLIAGVISAVATMLQFMFLFGGGDDEESPLGMVGSLLVMLVAPIGAMMLQLAVSRQREYLADATAARLIGEGRPLADALENLERGRRAIPLQVNPATASLYIVNLLSGGGAGKLFSTHPPIVERVRRLRVIDAELRASGAELRAVA